MPLSSFSSVMASVASLINPRRFSKSQHGHLSTHCSKSRLLCSCSRAILSDRKSTRLNSSHQIISYAVFCLKKKKKEKSKLEIKNLKLMKTYTTLESLDR